MYALCPPNVWPLPLDRMPHWLRPYAPSWFTVCALGLERMVIPSFTYAAYVRKWCSLGRRPMAIRSLAYAPYVRSRCGIRREPMVITLNQDAHYVQTVSSLRLIEMGITSLAYDHYIKSRCRSRSTVNRIMLPAYVDYSSSMYCCWLTSVDNTTKLAQVCDLCGKSKDSNQLGKYSTLFFAVEKLNNHLNAKGAKPREDPQRKAYFRRWLRS